jgi:hypothetical protein
LAKSGANPINFYTILRIKEFYRICPVSCGGIHLFTQWLLPFLCIVEIKWFCFEKFAVSGHIKRKLQLKNTPKINE